MKLITEKDIKTLASAYGTNSKIVQMSIEYHKNSNERGTSNIKTYDCYSNYYTNNYSETCEIKSCNDKMSRIFNNFIG